MKAHYHNSRSCADVALSGNGNLRPCIVQVDIYNVGARLHWNRFVALPSVAVACIQCPPFGQTPSQPGLNRIVSIVAAGNDTPDVPAAVSRGINIRAKRRRPFFRPDNLDTVGLDQRPHTTGIDFPAELATHRIGLPPLCQTRVQRVPRGGLLLGRANLRHRAQAEAKDDRTVAHQRVGANDALRPAHSHDETALQRLGKGMVTGSRPTPTGPRS